MNKKLVLKRIAFYLLSFTWGFIMSFIGLIAIGICACFKQVHTYHGRLYAVVGKDWGGLELGCFFICCESCANNDYLRGHECGHGLQNCLWGPLFPFVIGIPSAIRYWYFEFYSRKHNGEWPNLYDAIWFEGQATDWGKKYINKDLL